MKMKAFLLNTLLFFLLSTVVARSVYRYFVPMHSYSSEDWSLSHDITSEKMNYLLNKEGVFEAASGSSYDYNAMLHLITTAKEVKAKIQSSFRVSQKHGRNVVASMSSDAVHALLRGLLAERRKLRDYHWDLKGHFHGGIPSKRGRSLKYYLQVVEEAIADVRGLQRSYFTQQVTVKSSQVM